MKENDVPLTGLAEEIISLSRMGRGTPVLVTPRYLSLRHRFLVELVREISSSESFQRLEPDRTLRIDWLCNASLLRQRWARIRANRINRLIRRELGLGDHARVVVAASIGRREFARNTLILGLCDEDQDLPAWAQQIQLSGSPRHYPMPAT